MKNGVVKNKECLSYSGEVTLTETRNGKFIKRLTAHNSGKIPLFKFIMNCLSGTYNSQDVPMYIRIFDSNNQELTAKAIVRTGVPSVTLEDNSASVVLTFNVASSSLTSLTTIRAIKLYSSANSSSATVTNPSAEFEFDSDKSITEGSSLIVAWKMTISNKTISA